MSNYKSKQIIAAAVELAEKYGYRNITREQIAERAQVGNGTVTNVLGNVKQMRLAIIRHGVRVGNKTIIAQGTVAQEPYVIRKVSTDDRLAALKSVL